MAIEFGQQGRDTARPGTAGALEFLLAPLRPRTFRELAHHLLGLPLAVAAFALSVSLFATGLGLAVTFLGIPILAGCLMLARAFGRLERARARALLGLRVDDPAPVGTRRGKGQTWLGAVLKSGTNWRHLLYCLLHLPWACFSFTLAVTLWAYGWAALSYPLWQWTLPEYAHMSGIQLYGDETRTVYLDSAADLTLTALAGLLLTLATPWVLRALSSVDRVLVAGLLGPDRGESRLLELESDRGVVVDTAAADLRRIERALHDGAQARLDRLSVDLGVAKEKLTEDPEAAARMVDEAHGEVKAALQELRDLARGIHPAVLTDRGLDAALSSVATRCTVPVTLDIDLPTRPAPAIEGIAYFTVSELLQNISTHSHAHHAHIDLWRTEEHLLIRVHDDGRGGAQAAAGSGLASLAARLGAVDGLLRVDSPEGGPTEVTARLPWRS